MPKWSYGQKSCRLSGSRSLNSFFLCTDYKFEEPIQDELWRFKFEIFQRLFNEYLLVGKTN